MWATITLYELPLNQPAHISYLPANFALSAQLIEQGFALKSKISLAHKASFNGRLAYLSAAVCYQLAVFTSQPVHSFISIVVIMTVFFSIYYTLKRAGKKFSPYLRWFLIVNTQAFNNG
jgi:hypothetical protein